MKWATVVMGGLVAAATLGLVVFGGQPGHIIIGVGLTIAAFVLVMKLEQDEKLERDER